MAQFTMTDSQQVTLSIAYTDKRGNPASPPAGAAKPAWLVDNVDLLSLAPSDDGLSCVAASLGPLGRGTISVKVADASGAPLSAGSIDCTIVSGAPTSIAVTAGTPTDQP